MATTKFRIDPQNPPETSKEDLARYDAIVDEDIDYSDIPELDDSFFDRANLKERITMRLDADVLNWFKSQGKGYQTRMNTVLRAFYERHNDQGQE